MSYLINYTIIKACVSEINVLVSIHKLSINYSHVFLLHFFWQFTHFGVSLRDLIFSFFLITWYSFALLPSIVLSFFEVLFLLNVYSLSTSLPQLFLLLWKFIIIEFFLMHFHSFLLRNVNQTVCRIYVVTYTHRFRFKFATISKYSYCAHDHITHAERSPFRQPEKCLRRSPPDRRLIRIYVCDDQ